MSTKIIIHSFFIFLFFVSSSFNIKAQDTRGFYVDNFKSIIGHPAKEDQLLKFAQDNNFNYLLLYNLYFINRDLFDITNVASAAPLANFIYKAKTKYGIQQVAAVGEKFASFNTIDAYNQLFVGDSTRQFDVYHIEFEFWDESLIESYYCETYLNTNGYSCTTSGAFDFFYEEFQKLKSLTEVNNLKAETYIGNITSTQAKKIGHIADRVLVHYFRDSDEYRNGNSIYNFKSHRLEDLCVPDKVLDILPIFSSRSYFMGPWLLENSPEQAFDTYMNGHNGFVEEDGPWKSLINIQGYTWYRYSELYDYLSDGAINPIVKIELFPNPADKVVHIVFDDPKTVLVKVMDTIGKTIMSKLISSSHADQLEIDQLENGLYFVVFEFREGTGKVQKLYVEKGY